MSKKNVLLESELLKMPRALPISSSTAQHPLPPPHPRGPENADCPLEISELQLILSIHQNHGLRSTMEESGSRDDYG